MTGGACAQKPDLTRRAATLAMTQTVYKKF
jgi:hypothetical protein